MCAPQVFVFHDKYSGDGISETSETLVELLEPCRDLAKHLHALKKVCDRMTRDISDRIGSRQGHLCSSEKTWHGLLKS
jgi:hypothetical protein